MSYGFSFDNELREKLVKAALEYQKDPNKRAPLNEIIMEIQKPLKDKLDQVRRLVV